MKTTLRSLSYLLLFAVAGVMLPGAALPETPKAGKFLVLRNGRTMEGDIDLVGDKYRIRCNGGEMTIPAGQVLRLFRDTEDAYQFLRAKTKLDDPDERLRLAKWCLDLNLRGRALEEVTEALVLRPKDAETKRLLERIQEAPVAVVPKPVSTPAQPEAEPTTALVELTPEALGQFTHKVQPILMNACASCHATGHGGAFKLTKTSDVPAINHRATQDNLSAVLGQVNFAQPPASPLLAKAVSSHGGSEQPPLKGRQAVAYYTLEDWLRITLATNPQLAERLGVRTATMVPPPPPSHEARTVFADGKPESAHTVAPVAETLHPNVVPITPAPLTPVKAVAPPLIPSPTASTMKPSESGDDAYDPSEFNRQAHPERTPSPNP